MMQLVKTKASDGTEIFNYVNAGSIGAYSGGGAVFATTVDMATYSGFTSCVSNVAACNSIFYVKNGTVERYTPVGSGGARCYTDKRAKPDFSGPTNYR